MTQTLTDFEEAFHHEAVEEVERRGRLRAEAASRARDRRIARQRRGGTLRFGVLVLVLLASAVLVTVVMLETLALLMGA